MNLKTCAKGTKLRVYTLGIARSDMLQSLRFNFLRDLKPKKDAVASAQSVEFLRATTGKRGVNSLA